MSDILPPVPGRCLTEFARFFAVAARGAYQSASVFSSIDPASTAFWNASSSSGEIV